MQSMMLACLGLLLGQTPSDTVLLNRRVVQIPLTFQESRRAEIREILLFASADAGRNWQQVAAAAPDKDFISFTAPADGSYWLRVAAVNRLGKQEPENIRVGPPDRKLIIDTLKPLPRFTAAQRLGDEVQLAWDIQEDAPDWASFRLEWQVKDGSSFLWTAIPTAAARSGKAAFRPAIDSALSVRLSLKDQAGNLGTATVDVAATGIAAAGGLKPGGAEPIIPAIPIDSKDKLAPPPAADALPPPIKIGDAAWSTPPPAVDPFKAAPAGGEVFKPVAISSDPGAGLPPPVTRVALPPVQYFNRPEVPLEYELSKVGPSGIGSVDLFWTRDDGQTWEKYADDPAVQGTTKTGRFQRLIELPGDGVYGFALVVTSRAGRGKAPPRPGDAPQMRVEIDTLVPVAQLFSPVPDTTRPNTLLLRWLAKDKNLTANPVSLEWAERREGPWQPIALNLANSGQHPWTLPETIPVQVYLRLRVRDAAGNESVAVTPEPQLVDLSEPEGRLLGVSNPRP